MLTPAVTSWRTAVARAAKARPRDWRSAAFSSSKLNVSSGRSSLILSSASHTLSMGFIVPKTNLRQDSLASESPDWKNKLGGTPNSDNMDWAVSLRRVSSPSSGEGPTLCGCLAFGVGTV